MAGGNTTVARCFRVRRKDGVELGFTDHDRDLTFDGTLFRASSGMTARAYAQTTGLSVDTTEALGALSAEALTEEDLSSGRYDGAEVEGFLVNWADVAARVVRFRGTVGEVVRREGGYAAEVRGLAEALNREEGRIFHPRCSAVLGDARCGVDLAQPGYRAEVQVEGVEEGRVFRFTSLGSYAERWFEKGRFTVLDGAAAGLGGSVKADRVQATGVRAVELWQPLGVSPGVGDVVRVEAGCDRRAETCRSKFANFLNFRGFPHLPGEDWLMAYPVSGGPNDGGSRGATG
jgi:uncharacterized phage protein (TIGR02218 family)